MSEDAIGRVLHDTAGHKFVLAIDGSDDPAQAFYRVEPGGELAMIHTEVPFAASGQGIGSQLARGIFEIARRDGLRLVLRCPFLGEWYARHPEYGDVVSG